MGKKITIDEDLLGTIVLRLQYDNENMQAKMVLNHKLINEINGVMNRTEDGGKNMNEKPIEQAHLFNKMMVERFRIMKGTTMVVNAYGGKHEITIGWVNPHYYWFGSDYDGWILPESIISINGINAEETIAALRAEAYKDEGGKKDERKSKEKDPF
jgi:hypothetical protein